MGIILLILTTFCVYKVVTADIPEKKLKFIFLSILVDLAWIYLSLQEHHYGWAIIWFFISLIDLRAYKTLQDEIRD